MDTQLVPVLMVLSAFLKGNLHTHTTRSDGDVLPEAAVSWYADHGYDFLALSDHDFANVDDAPGLSQRHGITVVAGEEISSWTPSTRPPESYPRATISVHVNTFCATAGGRAVEGPTIAEALRTTVENARAVAPVVQINHPNYEGALGFRDFDGIPGPYLLEVANGNPHTNNDGSPVWPDYDVRPSAEQIWDGLLSRGVVVYGTATDDTHDFLRNPGFAPRRPGQAWVMVSADSRAPADICGALSQGRFYASTGVNLQRIVADGVQGTLAIDITPSVSGEEFITRFVGNGGRTLALQSGVSPRYTMGPDDSYVRAVVTSLSTVKSAWVQPVFRGQP
jgi:hypothetical protein